LIAQKSKINIAVLDLDATNINEEDARFLSDRLRIELFDAGTFNVLERDKMNVILDEQGFQISGCTSVECAVEIGQLLNVQQMVAGSVGRIGNVYSITLRLISVKTGQLLQTAKHDYQGELSEMLTEVLPEIARELSMDTEKKDLQDNKPQTKSGGRWGIQLKAGAAIADLISDFNNSIDDFNATFQPDLDSFSQMRSISASAVWDYDDSWRYNFGVQVAGMLDNWQLSLWDYTAESAITYKSMEIERSFSFVYIYADVDYKIRISDSFNFFLGTGLGINSISSIVKQGYETQINFQPLTEEKYNYVTLAIRLKAGLDYILSDQLLLSLEFSPVIQPKVESDDEYPTDNDAYLDFKEVLYPETLKGNMSTFTMGFIYYF